jgi:hypothetical protein
VGWRYTNHKGPLIRELLARYPRLQLEPMPAYAPQLNPVEFIWSYLKYGRLANFVPKHLCAIWIKPCKPTSAKSNTGRAYSNPFGSAQNYPFQIRTLLN